MDKKIPSEIFLLLQIKVSTENTSSKLYYFKGTGLANTRISKLLK